MNSLIKFAALSTLLALACNLPQTLAPPTQSIPLATGIPHGQSVATARPQTSTASDPVVILPAATFTASPVPTPTWILRGPGSVEVPILLYHHIDISPTNSRYYVSPDKFSAQMEWLHKRGYSTIPMDLLVEALLHGAELPPRPIIITFDDGNLDTYLTAFPIMRQYAFTGVIYIIGTYLGAPGYLDKEQILELVASGWEVGSHSMSHVDLLTLEDDAQMVELRESRRYLNSVLDVPILTFAYPLGSMDSNLAAEVSHAGYIAAVGTISSPSTQNVNYLYHLRRKEIIGSLDIDSFSSYLPWQEVVD